MTEYKKETKIEEPEKSTIEYCLWINQGRTSKPMWFTSGCNGQTVNVMKYMKRKHSFLHYCPFCGKTVDWKKAGEK